MKALLVGISGVSSSGKTSLARLLRDVWPGALILHEDDFYLPDKQIPVKDGLQDWDCQEAIDLERLEASLRFIRTHGDLPPDLVSKEDQNSVDKIDLDEDAVGRERERVAEFVNAHHPPRVIIIDGFLLFSEGMHAIRELLDVKLFLRTSYARMKARRERRIGYVTIEGFWEDPPGYIDKVVWPNYVKDHAFLFVDGDVEGSYDTEACNRLGINAIPEDAEADMTKGLLWASSMLLRTLRDLS